jgi:hypothetical protein
MSAVAFAMFATSGQTEIDRGGPDAITQDHNCRQRMAAAIFGSSSKRLRRGLTFRRLKPSVGQSPLPDGDPTKDAANNCAKVFARPIRNSRSAIRIRYDNALLSIYLQPILDKY